MSIEHTITLSSEEVAALEYALHLHLNPQGFMPYKPTHKDLLRLVPVQALMKQAMMMEQYEKMMETREGVDPSGTT